MKFMSVFMESIQTSNRLRTQNPAAGVAKAEQLISKYCDDNPATRSQSPAIGGDSKTPEPSLDPAYVPADNVAASLASDTIPALRSGTIESLAVANSVSPKLPQEPPLDLTPAPSLCAEPKSAEGRDRK